MKINRLLVFLLLIFALCVGAAAKHLNKTTKVEDGNILVLYSGREMLVDMENIELEHIEGIRINGKGEKINVNAEGIGLKRLLEYLDIKAETKITVIADDSYKAEISVEEIENDIEAFLVRDEENEIRLMVFGDSDSKRSVSDVTQIIIE